MIMLHHHPTEIVDYLDKLTVNLGRKVRVYVIGYKQISKKEVESLILDNISKYDWVNK